MEPDRVGRSQESGVQAAQLGAIGDVGDAGEERGVDAFAEDARAKVVLAVGLVRRLGPGCAGLGYQVALLVAALVEPRAAAISSPRSLM